MKTYNPKPVIGPISGFTNFSEAQHYAYAQWLARIAHAFQLYGFTPLIPRPVELRDNLHFKGGIGKQIYSLSRLDEAGTLAADGRPSVVGTDIGLPFDRTVPLAIWVAQYANEMTLPYKRYDIGWVFRGETAQAGRFRGFHQADVDIIGRQLDLSADVECLLAIAQALATLEVGSFAFHVNHIAIAKTLLKNAGVTAEQEAEVLRIIDKLEKIGATKVMHELHGAASQLTPDAVERLMQVFTFRGATPALRPVLEASGFADDVVLRGCQQLCEVEMLLSAAGKSDLKLVVNPGLVRGLDYYTGVVVETFIEGNEQAGSIASGGRYSNLVGGFSGRHDDIEGVGFSIGVTRLFDLLCRAQAVPLERKTTAQVVIAYRPEVQSVAVQVAMHLRAQGVNVDVYANPTKQMKHQLEYAAKKGVPYALMLMNAEGSARVDEFVLKNMTTREQVGWPTLEACKQECKNHLS